ncbi:hypothetical protein BDY21DRAFT_362749 [Lineolata rhizophorae]|uniref:Uncharacterized protein n=1 Tax=Lineolata rhizophorae TaxID=578093 RepID=A0A6A6P385_9PEZI|nr:hypothetical protein BDY21DRAFT_362749 [Lineolata rhizophorae]
MCSCDNNTPLLPDTAIAAANVGQSARVYYQLTDGSLATQIYQRDDYDQTWQWKRSEKSPATAKLFTPLAAIAEHDGDSLKWHVFFLNENNVLSDVHESGGTWSCGSLCNRNIQVPHFSKLACSWVASKTLRLYYQGDKGQIHSVTYKDKCWQSDCKPMSTDASLLGTSIAACQSAEIDQMAATCGIQEHSSDSVSATGIEDASSHSSISAVGTNEYRFIFFTTNQSKLMGQHVTKSGNTTSYIGKITPKSCIASLRNKVNDDDPDVIRVYCQRGEDNDMSKISEYRYTQDEGWVYRGNI